MSRLLFWIALAVLVVMAVRSKLREAANKSQSAAPGGRAASKQVESEKMARCAHCGVYFPASESVSADGRDYCSPAHVRQPPL
ncbi:MAG: PP0621 family protein [Massilia sp.]